MKQAFSVSPVWAFALAMLIAVPVFAQAETDLTGEWKGDSTGNRFRIEMQTGGLSMIFKQQSGQSERMYFRNAGLGTYLHDDGRVSRVQVLDPNAIRVTNEWNGLTNVYRRGRAPNIGSPSAPALTPKPAPKAAAPAKKLPPARPAKMAPWSPQAMPTAGYSPKTSPKFAAERIDALASCPAPIQHYASEFQLSLAEQNLIVEGTLLSDKNMSVSRGDLERYVAKLDADLSAGGLTSIQEKGLRMGRCLYQRRLAQLEGSPLVAGAIDGTLTPLSIGGKTPPWKQQGKDARIIASDGKSAMDCVKLVELTKSDSGMGGGGRVLSNQCSGPVEIVWCINPGECDREKGNMWTVQPGRSWPVSANGEVRWAACHGANTAAHVKGTFGLRYYCTAPAKK